MNIIAQQVVTALSNAPAQADDSVWVDCFFYGFWLPKWPSQTLTQQNAEMCGQNRHIFPGQNQGCKSPK